MILLTIQKLLTYLAFNQTRNEYKIWTVTQTRHSVMNLNNIHSTAIAKIVICKPLYPTEHHLDNLHSTAIAKIVTCKPLYPSELHNYNLHSNKLKNTKFNPVRYKI